MNNGLKQLTVDVSDIKVSDNPESLIVTYALGSCIALILHDPVNNIGGMIHYMLPHSRTSPDKAKKNPAMFADTGIPTLFKQMYALGSKKSDIIVKVAGGGKLWETKNSFDIGKRNYTMCRKILWKNSVMTTAEDVGGSKSRTVKLHVGTGKVTVHSKGEITEL